MEIAIGTGNREIVAVRAGERLGVVLRKTTPHPIGDLTDSVPGDECRIQDDDVCIWIDSLDSGRILQDTIALVLLKLQKVPLGTTTPAPAPAAGSEQQGRSE